jgi:hypothetical protein
VGATKVFVFEGGQAEGPVSRQLQAIRDVVARRLVRLWRAAGAEVVLASDRLEGATERTAADFHFGRALQELVRRHPCDRAVVMGGAALPLLRPADAARLLARLQRLSDGFLANNLFSPDIVAVSPAAALLRMEPVDRDNQLGLRLLDAGLRGVALADRARFKFDLDTPADAAVLATDPECPEEVAAALAPLEWLPRLRERVLAVQRALATPRARITIIGRVGPQVVAYIDAHLRCRLRVLSEERGMRALGREQAGLVRSLLGPWLDAVGAEAFFAGLGEEDAVVFDDRVLLSHWRRPLTDDERLRDFARWAAGAPAPVLLGGHSLVYGGLWRLAERAVAA